MTPTTTEGSRNVPASPALVIPNRMNLAALHALEEALGGHNRIAWMVENTLRPDAEIMLYLSQSRAAGLLYTMGQTNREELHKMVRSHMLQGRHVVMLCGHPGQQPGTLTDVPGKILSCLDGSIPTALPVYVGAFHSRIAVGSAPAASTEQQVVHILPVVQSESALGAAVRCAWMEAEAEHLATHPLPDNSLPRVLLQCLANHPDSMIIDGVDDSQLSCKRLLAFALIFAEKLRRTITNPRLGIILPPGKLATIANVSCLLAGIVPVNINYDGTKEDFRNQVEQSGINRFITEARFIHKQQQFPWPAQRDLLFIDRVLADVSPTSIRLRELAMRLGKFELLTRRLLHKPPHPENEAMLFFSSGTGGSAKGVPLSHRAILTSLLQMSSRLQLTAGQRALSTTPLYLPQGMLNGLLLPLVHGMDIVTYPDTQTPRRLCELIHNYSAVLTTFSPADTQKLLETGKRAQFSSLRYFLVTGERVPAELIQRAINEYGLMLRECYNLTESASPIAICGSAPAPAPGTPYIIPAGYTGSVGAPLPGVAVRISDLARPDKILPCTSTGLIWVKSPSIMKSYLRGSSHADNNPVDGWFCTGDVGRLDADGLLTISGRRARFSKIGDELVPHVAAEEALHHVLGIPQTGSTRRLAVVGVPNPRGGSEILVLLSTVHKTVLPQDLITVRYSLRNARYPAAWTPDRIFPVNAIPVLPNGKLDYPACYQGVCELMGLPTNRPHSS
ncbi:MAG: AMP-binding protein [Akkermansia sp.]|nr:AMP-binding protein [Akkermansia sp.]